MKCEQCGSKLLSAEERREIAADMLYKLLYKQECITEKIELVASIFSVNPDYLTDRLSELMG